MLTSRIHIRPPSEPQPEDIFQSSLHALFLDDSQNSHGNSGDTLIYQSPHYGTIKINVPNHPDDDARLLFAHYLWNASVLVADLVENASHSSGGPLSYRCPDEAGNYCNFRGEKVLELGAGTALPSIISLLAAASEVCITDHPSSPALNCGTIKANVQENLDAVKYKNSNSLFSIRPHEWGSITNDFANDRRNHFTRVIAADCLWMPLQHGNLIRSINHFLSKDSTNGCAIVVAGFHTGRNVVADFFRQFSPSEEMDSAAEELEIAEIYEIDMHGVKRPWQETRANEDREASKRWCVVAVVVRRA